MFIFIHAGWNVHVCEDICTCADLMWMKIHSAAIEGYYCHLLSHQRRNSRRFLWGVPTQMCKSVAHVLLSKTLRNKDWVRRHHRKSLTQCIHFQNAPDRNTLFTKSNKCKAMHRNSISSLTVCALATRLFSTGQVGLQPPSFTRLMWSFWYT